MKSLTLFGKRHLSVLLILLVTGCAITPVRVSQKELPLAVGSEPLIRARLGKVQIEPFRQSVIKRDKFYHHISGTTTSEYIIRQVEPRFRENFQLFLKSPGLFERSSKHSINVSAEFLSVKLYKPGMLKECADITVQYEFHAKDGSLLLAEKITSTGTKQAYGLGTLFAKGRVIESSTKSLSNNIEQLATVIQKKLPEAWQAYVERREAREAMEKAIAHSLKKESRYFRVVATYAVVRELPDAEARQVAKLSQAEIVHATGSLPSGWFQVSKEGRPIGWVHNSTLREDFASAPSYPTSSITPVTPPVLSEAPLSGATADVDVAALDLGTYYALVIGNNNYRYVQKLKTAVNDARSMAQVLQQKYGFKVQFLTDATRAQILDSLNAYRRNLDTHDNLLIFYAGHGWLDKEADEGYWLPVDAQEHSTTNWVSNSAITAVLRAMMAKHVIIVSDSCFSGKLARAIKPSIRTKNYYQKIARKKARTVLASGGLEPVADSGGKGNHSVFTSALIEVLNENKAIMDATLLFSKIRRPVMINSDQTPEYSDIRRAGHDGGDFLFVRRK